MAQEERERGARIRALREAIRPKLTQPKLAHALDVSYRTVQLWEAGKNVGDENLEKLTKFFGVSEDYILYGDEGQDEDGNGHTPAETAAEELVRRLAAIEAGQRALVGQNHTIINQNARIEAALIDFIDFARIAQQAATQPPEEQGEETPEDS